MSTLSQLGVAEQVDYETRAAPTRFFPFRTESLSRSNNIITSEAINGDGRALARAAQRVKVAESAAGALGFTVTFDQFGLWLKHALGNVTSGLVSGATETYEHVFTLGALFGKALTVQMGREADDGTVTPFDYVGGKVASWTLQNAVDQFVNLDLTMDFRQELTSESLAPKTLPFGDQAHFAQGALTKDGSPLAQVSELTVTGTNPMNTDRRYFGNAGFKSEPTDRGGKVTVTGEATFSFVDLAAYYTAFQSDTPVALSAAWTGPEIEAGYPQSLTIDLDDVRFTGGTPQVSGEDVPDVTVPFEAMIPDGGVPGDGITITLVNADATP